MNTGNKKKNATTILSLNNICLFEIFKQIRLQCETKPNDSEVHIVKYADLIHFVMSFNWFRVLFYHWDIQLYKLLRINKYYENTPDLMMDFGIIYNALQKSTKKEKNIFWKILVDGIESKLNLNRVVLRYTSGPYNEEHLEIFNMIIKALGKNNTSLIYSDIGVKGYTLDNLQFFCNLEELHLNGKIDAEELVKCCKLNPNLRRLSVLNNEIYGRLADIVRDGSKLQKLQKLVFLMKTEVNAVEYAPLAKLPSLDHLRIRGVHQIGSLRHLLSNLAAKKTPKNLVCLSIDDAPMDDDETRAISQIKSIEKLRLRFTEAKNIGHLSGMCKLRELDIRSEHEVASMLKEFVNILKETQQRSVTIIFWCGKMEYRKTNKHLTWTFSSIDASECGDLCYVPNLNSLHIRGYSHRTGSLQNLFRGFANRLPRTLQHLRLSKKEDELDFTMSRVEISEIACINSLENLNCAFGDLSNIYELEQLPHLKRLTMTMPSVLKMEEKQALKRLFQILASKPLPTLEYLDIFGASIDWSLTCELVQIKSLKHLKCSFSDDESIGLLSKFQQLNDLHITSEHEFTNISQGILQIKEKSKNLIRIYCNSTNCLIIYDDISHELTIHVAKNTNATSLGHLGNLENCQLLIVYGEYEMGSLCLLLKTLALRPNHSLKQLHIENTPITFEEALLISQIKSLQTISGKFLDPRSFEVLQSLTYLLYLKTHDTQLPTSQMLKFLNKYDEGITIENVGRKIIYSKNQGKLVIINNSHFRVAFNASDYACLMKLDNLQILHIYGHNETVPLKSLFAESAEFKPAPFLKELLIEERNKVID